MEMPLQRVFLPVNGANADILTYSRRKIFWDVIENLVRKGHTSNVAIDKTYLVYGRSNSVNTILLRMRDDRKNGGHPELSYR